jgi:IS1 family transposase
LDEKWSFVRKKQERCDPQKQADNTAGDCWDHVAMDAEHRLVLGVISGKRSATRILTLLQQVKAQMGGRTPRLVSSDEFGSYETVLKQVWPRCMVGRRDPRCTRRERRCPAPTEPDPALNYATVCKQRKDGRVVSVTTKVVFGTERSVAAALRDSKASRTINTSFLERHNGTDRHRNARKARRTYRFSKQWLVHEAVGRFTYYTYNFCWCVRTLAQRINQRGKRKNRTKWKQRTPAMAAGLTDHVWSLDQWLSYPIAGLSS